MCNLTHLAAINAIIDATGTRRPVAISLDEQELFHVVLEGGRKQLHRSAVAPQLCHALYALEFLDDGESVELDLKGIPTCQPSPSRWPVGGLRLMLYAKYAEANNPRP